MTSIAILNWLVVWNMIFIFPYIGNNHPNRLSYFSEGMKPTNQKRIFTTVPQHLQERHVEKIEHDLNIYYMEVALWLGNSLFLFSLLE